MTRSRDKRLRAVYLDLDDTLCDSEGLTPMRLAAVRKALTGEVPPQLLRAVMEEAASWDPLGLPGNPPNRLQRLGDALGLSDEQRQRMRAVYNRVLFENLRLHEGVNDLLAWLRQRVALGLITNGPADLQRRKIERLRIEPYFHSIIVSGEVGKHKPDPEIFQAALDSLSVQPNEALYVGDRPEADIAGARAVGITAVLVRKSYLYPLDHGAEADFVLDAIGDLPELLLSHGWLDGKSEASGAVDREGR